MYISDNLFTFQLSKLLKMICFMEFIGVCYSSTFFRIVGKIQALFEILHSFPKSFKIIMCAFKLEVRLSTFLNTLYGNIIVLRIFVKLLYVHPNIIVMNYLTIKKDYLTDNKQRSIKMRTCVCCVNHVFILNMRQKLYFQIV